MSGLRVTPIGTCRIHTPLKRATARYPLELDLRRNYGFVHTSGEALQLLQFLQGEKQFRPEVVPLLIRDQDLARFEAESWEASDLHIVEISSGKRLTCGAIAIQLNYLTRHFADFFASRERSRQFWSLLRNRDRKDLVEFLGGQISFRMLSKDDRDLLLSIANEQQSFSSIKADMAEITERLGKDRLVFVTHVNGRTPDGNVIPSRDRMIRWVKLAARELEVQCFDPTTYLEAFGQQRALEQEGLDLTHYTPAFADHIYDALHRSHVTTLLSGIGDGSEDPQRQHAMLATQFEAMLEMGDFVEVAREVHDAIRKAPDALPLVELRGLIRARIGDYPGAADDLMRRGDDTAMSEPTRVALLETLHKTGADEPALRVAENLIADEYENANIYRIASGAAERLGRFESAVAHAKQAFRRDRGDLATALHALMMLNAHGDAAESDAWRAEIIENAGAFATGAFQVCAWAIDNQDEQLFEAAIARDGSVDKSGIIDLLERALNAGLYRSAALALEQLSRAGDVARDLRKRRDEMVGRAVDEAGSLLENGKSGEALMLAGAAGVFRAVASRARILIRDVVKQQRIRERELSQRLRLTVRDAYARGDSAAVIEAAAGAEDSFIVHANTVVLVARSLGTLGRTREAIELLKQAHAANPEQLALGRWCGRLAAVEGDYATALRMYGSLDRDDPAFAAAAPEVERFFASIERRSLKKLRELLDADRIDDALDLIEELKARTGAAAACERELARKHRNLRLRLIEIEQGDGDIDEREPVLRAMLRVNPEDVSALRRLALEYMRQFRFTEAAECWEMLRKLNPENETVVRNSERCQILAQRRGNSTVKQVAA